MVTHKLKLKTYCLVLILNEDVIESAQKKLQLYHHPSSVLFYPLKNLDFSKSRIARMIEKLIKNNITLYSAHTNLDFTKDGVSFQLAKKLELKNIKFLKNLSENQFKLSVFVPVNHIDKVAEAIYQAGAGIIGEYSNCSFRTSGKEHLRVRIQAIRPSERKVILKKLRKLNLKFLLIHGN